MEAIWCFIKEYGYYIGFAIFLVLDVLLLILKKRPQVVDNGVYSRCIDLIRKAEAKFLQGADKKQYVMAQMKEYLGDNFSPSDVSMIIEFLLSLPQKKGVQYGTKKS